MFFYIAENEGGESALRKKSKTQTVKTFVDQHTEKSMKKKYVHSRYSKGEREAKKHFFYCSFMHRYNHCFDNIQTDKCPVE